MRLLIVDCLAGECKSASTAGKRRTVIGSESIFRSALRDQRTEAMAEGNSGAFVLRLDSPLTAITAIAVAICLLIITIFSIIFAVLQVMLMPDPLNYIPYNICLCFAFELQRNSNHVSRNSVRYRKIISKSSIGRSKCDASSNEARFIFNVGEEEEDPDDTDDNTDDDDNEHHLNGNTTRGTINRVVYEQQRQRQQQQQQRTNTSGPMNGNEFYIKSTNDIDAIEFHCSGVNNNAINVNTTNCSSSPTSSQQQQPPSTSKSNSKNNRRISNRSNVHS